jgi:hypothetical protein
LVNWTFAKRYYEITVEMASYDQKKQVNSSCELLNIIIILATIALGTAS